MNADARRSEYVRAVTRGAGLLPWQSAEPSAEEAAFRAAMEDRKTALLRDRMTVVRPALLRDEAVECARRNIEQADWARRWAREQQAAADAIAAMSPREIDRWIPEVTTAHAYGFTCPNCVGSRSQEGAGPDLIQWDYGDPERFFCRCCGQSYPDERFPEDARLECPRRGVTLHYYLNDAERADPGDRSGRLAYRWVGFPLHMNFTLLLQTLRMRFLLNHLEVLALFHRLTGERRYGQAAARILVRLSHVYPRWLYHDYWDTVADCDPLYAAWHDRHLPLEFKRHLCEEAFQRDTPETAAMLQNYWGAGRAHPDTGDARFVAPICTAYDSLLASGDADLLPEADRERIERDLILEWILESECYVGGPGKAETVNNKAPRIYAAMAAAGVCLGAPTFADAGLKGYEAIRDQAFNDDGFSTETPIYTMMYLDQIARVPDLLDGFAWPHGYPGREGVVRLHTTDARLKRMYQALVEALRPDGRHLPLGDSMVDSPPGWFMHLYERGLRRYPDVFRGHMPTLYRGGTPDAPGDHRANGLRAEPVGLTALLHCDAADLAAETGGTLPEIYFPQWMTAILRHGKGPAGSVLSLTFSPPGGHRQHDNLALFYADGPHALIGDLGYVCDMPVNKWVRETFSHNVVIVDGEQQITGGGEERVPAFHWMFATPLASGVEASSRVYRQCSRYQRTVLLVKGPEGRTFVIDLFRVAGGKRHDYRIFSELAASDGQDTSWEFAGLQLPREAPLPDVAGSLAPEDIFGLRDTRTDPSPSATWQAIWKQTDRRYRFWCLSQCTQVDASNGPGQESRRDDMGRRVRYLDLINEGPDLTSSYVIVHEPSERDGGFSIRSIERLTPPPEAGADAVALRIVSDWGTYLFLSEFAGEATIDGIRLQGTGALVRFSGTEPAEWMTLGAQSLEMDGAGFRQAAGWWEGDVATSDADRITTRTRRPPDWPETPPECAVWSAVREERYWTGYPAARTKEQTIYTERFPLGKAAAFRLPALNWRRTREDDGE